MYTFVFMANRENKLSEGFLRDCAKITKKWTPALGLEMIEKFAVFPECNSGWFHLAPVCDRKFSYITEVIDQRYAVIVFGDIFDCGPHSAAQIVFDAWMSGGSNKVRKLEGCFSSVILDRTDGAVVLIGDGMGRRALSFYANGEMLIVSPHDVALMATGRVPVEFDYASIATVAAVNWSLRGRSLLKQVQVSHAAEYIRWADGRIQHIVDSVIDPGQRIVEGDSTAVSRHLDHMIETAQSHAQIFAANQQEIKCDLSGGRDSRVTWSLLLSVIDDPSRIIATSIGETNCMDVRIASRLAKMYGTRFATFVEDSPSPEEFLSRCDLLAFHVNGGTHGVRAMKYSAEFILHPKTYACGAGGERYRGTFYPHEPYSMPLDLSPDDTVRILRKRTRLDKLPWISSEMADGVMARLNAVVEELATFSENGYDILDMFGLYEQFAVWGAAQERQTWKDPRWSPFISPKLIRMSYMMPAPIGQYATIHQESLRRFTPRAYWVRSNGELLPFEGEGAVKRLLKKIDNSFQFRLRRVQRAVTSDRTPSQSKNMDQLAQDFLAGPLMEPVREILMSDGSFAQEIFGKLGVELLLNEHKSRRKNHVGVLGLLVSMERWRGMVQGVVREAAAVQI